MRHMMISLVGIVGAGLILVLVMRMLGEMAVMSLVFLTAVLSCPSSGLLYTASRMLNALARRVAAPTFFLDVNSRSVPAKSMLLCASVGFLSLVMAIYLPDTVFLFLLNTSGAIALFAYLLIVVSELRLRRRLEREAPERLQLKMWLHPYLTILTIVLLVEVIASMGIIVEMRIQLALCLLSASLVLLAYFVFRHGRSGGGSCPDATRTSDVRAGSEER